MKNLILLIVPLMALGCRGMDSVREDREEGTVNAQAGLSTEKALVLAKVVMND